METANCMVYKPKDFTGTSGQALDCGCSMDIWAIITFLYFFSWDIQWLR